MAGRNGLRRSGLYAIAPVPPFGPADEPPTIEDAAELGARLRANIDSAVRLPAAALDVLLASLLAGGHVLIEDHPGVGKTQLARTLARSLSMHFARVQATVDLLPADIIGTNVWRPETQMFEFQPGPVFAHIVLVDELNRATPKTQSGLLEAMQEGQVTVDGESLPLPTPFMVIATQNPSAGYDGTYPLPPAQLDRFLARVSLGYPTFQQEIAMLSAGQVPVSPVTTPIELLGAQTAVAGVHSSETLLRYVVELLAATREHPLVQVGASPRAGLLLLAAARAHAALQRRRYVIPDDVQAMAQAVLQHRLQLRTSTSETAESVITDVLARVAAR